MFRIIVCAVFLAAAALLLGCELETAEFNPAVNVNVNSDTTIETVTVSTNLSNGAGESTSL
jgi:hypothetical protein